MRISNSEYLVISFDKNGYLDPIEVKSYRRNYPSVRICYTCHRVNLFTAPIGYFGSMQDGIIWGPAKLEFRSNQGRLEINIFYGEEK